MAEQTQPGIETIDLKGKKLFKVSHGYLVKNSNIKDHKVAKLFEEKKWISLSQYTGKNQGEKFMKTAKIGDFVYVCYGGYDLVCLGRIISDFKAVESPYDEMIEDTGEWIYREIEVIKLPTITNVRDLKDDRRFHMPSGNSTFYEVSRVVLNKINDDLFIPKFGIKFKEKLAFTCKDKKSRKK